MFSPIKKSILLGLGLLFSTNLFAQTFRGDLEVLIADDFNNNKALKIYNLRQGKTIYQLLLPTETKVSQLKTGQSIVVEGSEVKTLQGNQIQVESIVVDSKQKTLLPQSFRDERRALAILVDFNDKKATNTLSTGAIDDQMYLSNTSVRALYKKSSSSQVLFTRDPNGDGQYITTVNLDYNAGTACDVYNWADDALDAAAAAGIDLGSFQHAMYILPANVSCPWTGLGTYQCAGTSFSCEVWVKGFANSRFTMAHELGHNLGVDHSATDTNNNGIPEIEYGDFSCIMGNGGYRQINAVHRDQLNWFAAAPKKIRTITNSGKFNLFSLDKNRKRLQVLKINRADENGTYYISYRTAHGPFGMGAAYSNKINVHRTLPFDTHSYFIKALSVGESFIDEANAITVTALETLEGKGVVEVTLGQ